MLLKGFTKDRKGKPPLSEKEMKDYNMFKAKIGKLQK